MFVWSEEYVTFYIQRIWEGEIIRGNRIYLSIDPHLTGIAMVSAEILETSRIVRPQAIILSGIFDSSHYFYYNLINLLNMSFALVSLNALSQATICDL